MRFVSRSVLLGLGVVFAVSAMMTSGASAHQWLVNGVEASGQEVSVSGGLVSWRLNTGQSIGCEGVTGRGTVKAGGLGEMTEIVWSGCVTGESGCLVKSPGQPAGTIVMTGIHTALVTRSGVLAEDFKGKGASENGEVVKLEFEPEPGESCGSYGTGGAVTGQIAGKVSNLSNGKVELGFPGEELSGNTLSYFGILLKWSFKSTESLVAGGSLSAS